MGLPIATEQQMLTEPEFEVVKQSHYREIWSLSKDELAAAVRRLRDYRNKARDVSRQQRREIRGKAEPHGAPGPGQHRHPDEEADFSRVRSDA